MNFSILKTFPRPNKTALADDTNETWTLAFGPTFFESLTCNICFVSKDFSVSPVSTEILINLNIFFGILLKDAINE